MNGRIIFVLKSGCCNIFVVRDILRSKISKWEVDLLENEEMYLFKFTYKNGKGLVDRIYRSKAEIDKVEEILPVADSIYNDFVCDLLDFFLDPVKEN